MKTFIVVSAYNEEERIEKFLLELVKEKKPVIVVDDGSKDKTWNVLLHNARKHGLLTILRHKVNLGKGAAMTTGVEAAFGLGADAVVFMDGDGQHDVSDLQKFTEGLKTADVVLGEREIVKGTSLRIYGSRLLSFLANFLYGVMVKDFLCGYRGITKNAYKQIKWNSTDYGVETEMLARIGKSGVRYKIVQVRSIYHDTFKGFSVIDGVKLLYNIVSWKLTI